MPKPPSNKRTNLRDTLRSQFKVKEKIGHVEPNRQKRVKTFRTPGIK